MRTQQGVFIADRFRGFLPVVVDIETGGFNPRTDALLEIAAVFVMMDEKGFLSLGQTVAHHVEPFPGSKLNPESMAVNGIDPYHPFRMAVPEQEALSSIFRAVRREVKAARCNRAILVGHNAFFDLSFLNAASDRCELKRNPVSSLQQLRYGFTGRSGLRPNRLIPRGSGCGFKLG